MFFNPSAILNYLPYMGIGMLGVFMIVGIIIFATFLIGKCTNKNSDKKE